MKAIFVNSYGKSKKVKLGFSWTTFFFGFLVPLVRGDFKWFIILFLLDAVFGIPSSGIGSFIINIIFSFNYNKYYIQELYKKGYYPIEEHDYAVRQYIS